MNHFNSTKEINYVDEFIHLNLKSSVYEYKTIIIILNTKKSYVYLLFTLELKKCEMEKKNN